MKNYGQFKNQCIIIIILLSICEFICICILVPYGYRCSLNLKESVGSPGIYDRLVVSELELIYLQIIFTPECA